MLLNLTIESDTPDSALQVLLGHLPPGTDDDARSALAQVVASVQPITENAKGYIVLCLGCEVLGYHVEFKRHTNGSGVSLHVCDGPKRSR